MVIYSLNHFFLAVPMACRVSWVRDQTRATAANQASAVTKWEPSPALLMLFFFLKVSTIYSGMMVQLHLSALNMGALRFQ